MIIQPNKSGFQHPISSEITPESVYQSRRDIIRQLATGSAGLALAAWGMREAHAQTPRAGQLAPLASVPSAVALWWMRILLTVTYTWS